MGIPWHLWGSLGIPRESLEIPWNHRWKRRKTKGNHCHETYPEGWTAEICQAFFWLKWFAQCLKFYALMVLWYERTLCKDLINTSKKWQTNIWCSKSTLFPQTWQNRAPISSFSRNQTLKIRWKLYGTLRSTRGTLNSTRYTLHATLDNPQLETTQQIHAATARLSPSTFSTSYATSHSTLYTSTLHTFSTLYTSHSTFHALRSTLHTEDSTLHTPHSTLHTLHFTCSTPHSNFTSSKRQALQQPPGHGERRD